MNQKSVVPLNRCSDYTSDSYHRRAFTGGNRQALENHNLRFAYCLQGTPLLKSDLSRDVLCVIIRPNLRRYNTRGRCFFFGNCAETGKSAAATSNAQYERVLENVFMQ
jgi:hypothetical protein